MPTTEPTRTGAAFCLASGAAFGAMAIFAKLAYDEGANVATLLAARFVLAALLFWAAVLVRRGARSALRALQRRDVAAGLTLGAAGYALQSGLYFSALERLDASLLALLLYTFPAIVAVSAVALGRDRLDGRRGFALGLSLGGLALVLAGAGTGAIDPLGTTLGLGAAVVYAAYILISDGVAERVGAIVLAALVCTGAALSLTLGGVVLGQLEPGALSAGGWLWVLALVVVSTVGAIGLFFAGLRRAGPTAASILATVEPVVTVVLAFALFAETLGSVQIAGGLLVLGAVVVLQLKTRERVAA